jgi:hypothetical protein
VWGCHQHVGHISAASRPRLSIDRLIQQTNLLSPDWWTA